MQSHCALGPSRPNETPLQAVTAGPSGFWVAKKKGSVCCVSIFFSVFIGWLRVLMELADRVLVEKLDINFQLVRNDGHSGLSSTLRRATRFNLASRWSSLAATHSSASGKSVHRRHE